jgi:Rrf2 family protein
MRLSKQTTDAIRILSVCHQETGRLVKVGHVADELGLTKQVALKTANMLVQAGLLEAVRGPNGGIRLSRETADASIADIVRAIETAPGRSIKGNDAAALSTFINDAFQAFLRALEGHKLADLAKARSRKQPNSRPARPAGSIRKSSPARTPT